MAGLISDLNRTLPLLLQDLSDTTFAKSNAIRGLLASPQSVKLHKGRAQSIIVPVNIGYHSIAKEIATGADAYAPFDTTVGLIEQKATATWFSANQKVSISEDELNAQDSEGAVNILKGRVENVMHDMSDRIARSILMGAAETDATRRFTTLQSFNGIVSSTGWFDGVAPASQNNVVLGLDEATYRGFGWRSGFVDASGTLTLDHVNEMINQIAARNGVGPDIAIVSSEFMNRLSGLVDTKIQYIAEKDLGFGFLGQLSPKQKRVPVYNDIALYMDDRMGFDADGAGVGTTKIDAYFLSSSDYEVHVATYQGGGIAEARKKLGLQDTPAIFSVSEFIRDSNAPVYNAIISCTMQVVTKNLSAHGMLVNA